MNEKSGTLSDFGFERVVTHFKLKKEEHHEQAAMRAVFRDCVSHICNFSDAPGSRSRAADIAIQKIEPRYAQLRHADDFFNEDDRYNKGALAWAVIAGDLVFEADSSDGNDRVIIKAQRIVEDCSALKGDEHFEHYVFAPESFFAFHVDALEDLAYLELHFEGWSLEELKDKQADGFSLYKRYMRPDTAIGEELFEQIRMVEEKIAAFVAAQPPISEPKAVHTSEVIAFPFPKQ
jgi:hypothetical protein